MHEIEPRDRIYRGALAVVIDENVYTPEAGRLRAAGPVGPVVSADDGGRDRV